MAVGEVQGLQPSRQDNSFQNVTQHGAGVLFAGNSLNTAGGDIIFGTIHPTHVAICDVLFFMPRLIVDPQDQGSRLEPIM